ncbi:MAG: hypothetical protein MZV64_56620 [Ignavibacteriales bacterium]|nr:hypothetical protein [Ignavibacteriales bacterium]
MREQIKIIIIVFAVFLSNSFSQTKYILSLDLKEKKLPFGLTDFVPEHKPEIAFALSGGGARGFPK